MTTPELLIHRTLLAGRDLSLAESREMVSAIVSGQWTRRQTMDCLLALRQKGETADEIAGAAMAIRERMARITTRHPFLIDTCGTGGDGWSIFNVSTAAALVAAAAGLPVAKHGNRGVSSRSGSADVLRELGVDIESPLAQVQRCLDELEICFCYAPLWHESVRSVAAIRAELRVPTIFNWLGPLVNPAGAPFQLLGVGRSPLRRPMAHVLLKLGTARSAVVHARDGLDEISIAAPTDVSLVSGEKIDELTWTAEDFGLTTSTLAGLQVSSPQESASLIWSVLTGQAGAARDLVVINAAAALWVAGLEPSLPNARQRAESAIDSGRAAERLAQLRELSHRRDS